MPTGEVFPHQLTGDNPTLARDPVTISVTGFEGHGVGSRLVQGALDDLRARGLAVVPLCPFVAGFIDRHPEYADLVTTDEER